jgi:hypothetical protein
MVGSGPINHRIFSFYRKFSLKKMTGWRFEPPIFGTIAFFSLRYRLFGLLSLNTLVRHHNFTFYVKNGKRTEFYHFLPNYKFRFLALYVSSFKEKVSLAILNTNIKKRFCVITKINNNILYGWRLKSNLYTNHNTLKSSEFVLRLQKKRHILVIFIFSELRPISALDQPLLRDLSGLFVVVFGYDLWLLGHNFFFTRIKAVFVFLAQSE